MKIKTLLASAVLVLSTACASAQLVGPPVNYGSSPGSSGGSGTCTGSFCDATAPLAANLGGNGLDNSGATGFPLWTAGVQSIVSSTGTGNVVRSASPTLTGTISAAALTLSSTLTTNITGSTQCVTANSSGVLSGTGSACGSGGGGGTPGGSDTQLQYNNAGSFGGITGAVSNGTIVTLTSPVFVTPALGTPASGVGTNITGLNGTNISSGTVACARQPALTGDVTTSAGSCATTAATVNSNVGSFTNSNITVNAKGQVTAAANGSSTSVSVTSASANIVVNPTPGTGTFTVGAAFLINAQTGTSYALLSGDGGKLVTFSNGSATAVSIAQAGTTGFGAGYSTTIQNKGAGTVTITPTTSTINGSATLTVVTNRGCSITSDGTNYQISDCTAILP